MKLSKILLFTLVSTGILITSCQRSDAPIASVEQHEHGEIIPGKYVVIFQPDLFPEHKFKTEMSYDQSIELAKNEIFQLEKSIIGKTTHQEYTYYKGVFGFAGELTDAQVKAMKLDPRVKSVEPDRYVMLAPPPGKGPNKDNGDGGGETASQTTPWGITKIGGGVSAPTGVKAWIIDTGVDQDHPDLNVNTSLSRSFLSGRGSNDPDDDNGHGTHVAGTIAAIDNSEGVIGVAAGAQVVSVRVLDRRGSGTFSGVMAGVQYVGANAGPNDVANMSLGGGISTSLDDAVLAASSTCVFVLAAGNESDNALNHSPARVGGQSTRIHTISAMNSSQNFAGFSNYGSAVDYCQPGVNVESCWKNGGYNTISGTSMAAPHMSGLVLIGYTSNSTFVVNNDPDGNADPIAFHN